MTRTAKAWVAEARLRLEQVLVRVRWPSWGPGMTASVALSVVQLQVGHRGKATDNMEMYCSRSVILVSTWFTN